MMDAQDARLLEPVPGQVTLRSRKEAALFLVAFTVMLTAGLVLIGLWWFSGAAVLLKLAIIGGAGALGGLLGIPIFVFHLAAAPRVVLGKDRLQVVWWTARVVAQVPYANVAGVSLVKFRDARSIRIDLRDVDDPDTYLGRHKGASYDLWPLLYTRRPKDVVEALHILVAEFRAGNKARP